MIRIADRARSSYPDIYTVGAVAALESLSPLDARRYELMQQRIKRRNDRARDRRPIEFLPDDAVIDGTSIRVADARAGRFQGAVIPADLRRQWIQGTGPGNQAAINHSIGAAPSRLRDAFGSRRLDVRRRRRARASRCDVAGQPAHLKLMTAEDPQFLTVAKQVAGEVNAWAKGFLGRETIADWREQTRVTTRIFRARGLHLDDRHIAHADGRGFSASIADLVLYVTNNYAALGAQRRSIVLYLPKIQTAAEAAYWNLLLDTLEDHLSLKRGTIVCYVLVEQIEACFPNEPRPVRSRRGRSAWHRSITSRQWRFRSCPRTSA